MIVENVCCNCKNWEAINKSNNAGVCTKKCKKTISAKDVFAVNADTYWYNTCLEHSRKNEEN